MPRDEARDLIVTLCRLREQAMTSPSVFDRGRARVYAVEFLKNGDHASSLATALRKTSNYKASDYVTLAFDDAETLSARSDLGPVGDPAQEQVFAEIALAVYGPLLQRRVVA
jgi:hypothetical protein